MRLVVEPQMIFRCACVRPVEVCAIPAALNQACGWIYEKDI